MSSLLAAKCCCGGGCDTGCECPGTATLPSSVLVSFTFTDCCGTSRSAAVTVPLVPPFTLVECPSCLFCNKYEYHPTYTAGGCTQLCVGDLISWGCPNGSGGCTETQAIIGQVALSTDGCIYRPDYGNCTEWTLSVTVNARGQSATVGPSKYNFAGRCQCGWAMSACEFQADCFSGNWTVCKSGTADPRGTYTSCVGQPAESCDYTLAPCPTGPDAPAPVVVVS